MVSLKHTISSWYLPSRGLPAQVEDLGKLSSSNQAANSELEVQLELERKRAQEARKNGYRKSHLQKPAVQSANKAPKDP